MTQDNQWVVVLFPQSEKCGESLTWWSGVFATGIGVALAVGADNPAWGVAGEVLAQLTGSGTSPASLILGGLTAIGLRAKLRRAK
jgi:hypothetical protein